jgi:hypothetical protein
MKLGKWMVCGVAALLLASWSYSVAQDAGADKPKDRAARADRRPGGEAGARGGMAFGPAAFDYAGVAKELGLDAAQSEKLAGLILNQLVGGRYQRLGIDDAQKGKIKDACLAAGKDLLAATDAQGKTTAVRAIEEKIRTDVLTDEQKQKMGAGRGGDRERQPGAAGEGRRPRAGAEKPAAEK